MPFKLRSLPSYERCVKKLGSREKHAAKLIIEALTVYFHSEYPVGKVFEASLEGRSYRLVFKKLRGTTWEAYLEGKMRVLTHLEKGTHYLVFAGNHDQVRQFPKEN